MGLAEIPIFILAGGLGTRLKEHTEFLPKPMVEIGSYPIIVHIMRWYSRFGFKRFVVCTGFKSEVIKDFFLFYDAMNSDFTVSLASREVEYHSAHHNDDWKVTIAYTGEATMTGGRLGRATARYLGNAEHFAVTYGDGLTDANLKDEFEYHLAHKRVGTVLGVNPASRFGDLLLEGDIVREFAEKPPLTESWINGGYFFFRREFTDFLSSDENLVFEREPLTTLARKGQLQIYRHNSFWACMDTQRDKEQLDALWRSGKAPWAPPGSQT